MQLVVIVVIFRVKFPITFEHSLQVVEKQWKIKYNLITRSEVDDSVAFVLLNALICQQR